MAMMQTGGAFLEEQNAVLHQRLDRTELAVEDSNQRISEIQNKQQDQDYAIASLSDELKQLRLEHSKAIDDLRGELNVQRAWAPAGRINPPGPVNGKGKPPDAPNSVNPGTGASNGVDLFAFTHAHAGGLPIIPVNALMQRAVTLVGVPKGQL